jgi:hypothetical protein
VLATRDAQPITIHPEEAMAVQVGVVNIPTDPAKVRAERQRLDGLSDAQRAEAIKDAKGVIGTQRRSGQLIQGNTPQGSANAAATLEAAGIANVEATDPDL